MGNSADKRAAAALHNRDYIKPKEPPKPRKRNRNAEAKLMHMIAILAAITLTEKP